jgi:transcriptional regulator with XRE-family HTH domain
VWEEMALAGKPIEVVVGQRLAAVRAERRTSLDDLCSLLGVSPSRIAEYEGGVVRIPAAHLILLCDFFQVKPSHFFPRIYANRDSTLH